MKNRISLLLCLALGATTFSCSDADPAPVVPAGNRPLNEWAQSMWQIEQIASEAETIARGTWANNSSFLACSSVQNVGTDLGLETAFTFSDAAPCQDGKTRSGKIILFTKNPAGQEPALQESVLRFEDYRVNGAKLEGAFAFMMKVVPGRNSAMRMVSSNTQYIPATGDSYSYSLARETHLKEGKDTFYDPSDDVVELYEAEYSCLKRNGAFQANLVSPVVLKKACPTPANLKPLQGKIQISMTTGQKTILNFGDGTCAATPFAE